MERNFTHYHFDGQKENEEILLVLHRHWFDILVQFVVVFFMIAIFLGSLVFTTFFYGTSFSFFEFRNLISFLQNTFFIFIWIIFFLIWIDYYFDVWIVTDERIVNIEQKGLFSRVVSELKLENIQDITTDVKGVIPTFLNYGNLYVQTAAEMERFVFRNIPDPYSVKDLIMKLQKKFERDEEVEFSRMLSDKIIHKEKL